MKIIKDVKLAFGQQLKKYRAVAGLSQKEYGEVVGVDQSYITKFESGKKDAQIENMQKHATVFGVNYYQLANPDFPIPTLKEMPYAIRRAAARAEKEREKQAAASDAKKEAGEKVYQTGSAKLLHGLINDGFFGEPRTSKEAFLKLNTQLKEDALSADHTKAIHKITATLSQGKFTSLLDKLEAAKGSTAVRFVEKG